HPDTVRAPDVSFLSRERLAEHPVPETGFYPGAPDLAVEVMSPSDRRAEVEEKVAEYLDAGAREVWVVDTALTLVDVITKRSRRSLQRHEVLTTEILPGFSLPLADLFSL